MAKMTRCPAGHVYDKEAHDACPECTRAGVRETSDAQAVEGKKDEQKSDDQKDGKRSLPFAWLAGGAAALVVLIAAGIFLYRQPSPPSQAPKPAPSAPAAGTAPTAAVNPDADQDFQTCNKGAGDAGVAACGKAIASGKFSGSNLALLYSDRGVLLGSKNELDAALADYSEAIRLDPSKFGALNNRGNLYTNRGQFDLALNDFAQAIKVNPSFAASFNNRGVAYKAKGDYDRAIQDFDEAIRLDPKDAAAFNNRGLAYKHKGDDDHAVQDFVQAIQIDPNYLFAYWNRGDLYREKKDFGRAVDDYKKAFLLRPNDAQRKQIEESLSDSQKELERIERARASGGADSGASPTGGQPKSNASGEAPSPAPAAPAAAGSPNPPSGNTPPSNAPSPSAAPATGDGPSSSPASPAPDATAPKPPSAEATPAPAAPSGWPTSPVPANNFADETTDWGVPQQTVLQKDLSRRTPMNLPGARRITTQEMQQIGPQHLLIDVMDDTGHHLTIPGAVYLPGGGDYGRGRFNDQIQKDFLDVLSHLTRRNADQPIIFFCYGAECWEAYNATLRAINMGFRNVLWYRGGLASWKAANLPLVEPVEIDRVR